MTALMVTSWSAFGLGLLVFGFAPGAVTRLLVRMYPKGDPRRAERVAEVYVVAWYRRPMWVAQQLEVGLSEGLAARWRNRRRIRSTVVTDAEIATFTHSIYGKPVTESVRGALGARTDPSAPPEMRL